MNDIEVIETYHRKSQANLHEQLKQQLKAIKKHQEGGDEYTMQYS